MRNRPTKLNKVVKISILIGTFLFFFALSYSTSEARSGCCSHHGGVCGCGCCDGTGLSATCAPYYPACNSAPTPKVIYTPPAPVSPTPVLAPAPKEILVSNNAENLQEKIKKEIKKVESKYYENPDGFREKLVQQTATYLGTNEKTVGDLVYSMLPNIYNRSDAELIYKIRMEVKNVEAKYYKNPHGFREKLTQQVANYLGTNEHIVGEQVYSILPNI